MTHDIDYVTKFKSWRNVFSAVKRGENSFFEAARLYKESKENRSTDPYWTMLEMLNLNNDAGVETQFYFMADRTNTRFDRNDYKVSDIDIKELITELKINGASIGLHPSYETYLDGDQIKREKALLEEVAGQEIVLSRQHYLRYQDPETFKLLAKAGIKIDSSIGPRKAVKIHGNYGKAYEIYHDDVHALQEQPFLLMDTHLLANPDKMLQEAEIAINEIKNNEGTAVIIWHNNNFETDEQKEKYKYLLRLLGSNN